MTLIIQIIGSEEHENW